MEDSHSTSPTASDVLPRRLTSLAPELKHAIFVYLPDVPSAKALALSSSSFYHAFLDAQALILCQVLQNEMDTEMLRDCLAALRVSQIQIWSKEAILKILDDYFGGSLTPRSHTWRLSEALAISKVHGCVDFFATEFASSALSKNPTARGANAAPSSSEMRRIKLALHRFELHCNLFRYPSHNRMVRNKLDRNRLIRPDPFSAQEQHICFIEKFSPWENEQLGCVHEFLLQELTIPFCDVAKHDVDWGENSVPYVRGDRSEEEVYMAPHLSKGLEYLFRLVTADTYNARHDILHERDQGSDVRGRYRNRFSVVLRSQVEDDGVPLNEYTEEDEKRYLHPSFDSDNDRGPVEAWRWAHSKSSRSAFWFREDHQPLLQRGYVLWDLKRLIDWKILEKPVEDIIARKYLGYFERVERRAEREGQMESWKERSRIWQEGGRGWWAPGDESRVQWPSNHPKSKKPLPPNARREFFLGIPKIPKAARDLD